MSKLKSPEFMVFIASACFGLGPIFIKILIDHLTPVAVLSYRFLFVIVTFPLIVVFLRKNSFKGLIFINKTEFKHFFFLSLILVADMVLFFQSFYYIEVNKVLFLFLTYPIMTLIIARIFLKERISLTDITATFISLAGIVLIFWSKLDFDFNAYKGELMVLISALLWAGYIVLNRSSGETINHYKKTFWLFLLNFIMILPILLAYGKPLSFLQMKFYHALLFLGLSVISTLIPYTLLSYTAKYVKSSTSSMILLFGSVISILLSFIVLKEKPPSNVISGGLLILVSAFISTYTVEKIFFASKYFANKIKTILFGY